MAKKTNYEVNGKKYYRSRMTIDGKVIAFYGESKKDVEAQIEAYKESQNEEAFAYLINDWLEIIKRPMLSQSSYLKYEQVLRLHIKGAPFISKPIGKVSDLDLQRHINSLEGPGVIKTTYNLLKAFFAYCVRSRKLTYNPMLNVTLPKIPYKAPEKKYLSDADIDKLLTAFKNDKDLFPYVFIMMTGLRRGEISALKVKDIDLNHMTIKVYKSLNRVSFEGKSKTLISNTKTQSSIREIPISSDLIPAIKEHLLSEKKKHFQKGFAYNDETLFFTSTICTPIRGDRLTTRWENVQVSLGIEPITLHGLRHTFGTFLAKQGIPIQVVSKLMGHSDIATTVKIYTHIDQEQMKKAVDVFSKYQVVK